MLRMYGRFTYIWVIFMKNVGKYYLICYTWILWDGIFIILYIPEWLKFMVN